LSSYKKCSDNPFVWSCITRCRIEICFHNKLLFDFVDGRDVRYFLKLVYLLPTTAALAANVSFSSVCSVKTAAFATPPSVLAVLALATAVGH
jgi:hypothetical protein